MQGFRRGRARRLCSPARGPADVRLKWSGSKLVAQRLHLFQWRPRPMPEASHFFPNASALNRAHREAPRPRPGEWPPRANHLDTQRRQPRALRSARDDQYWPPPPSAASSWPSAR